MKKLYVYKGFAPEDLEKIDKLPLVNCQLSFKLDIENLDDNYKKNLIGKLIEFTGERYVTYEEFVLIYELGEEILRLSNVEIILVRNTIFPEYYPVYVNNVIFMDKIEKTHHYFTNIDDEDSKSEEIDQILRFYGDIKLVENNYYISYKNLEKELSNIRIVDTIDEYNDFNLNEIEVQIGLHIEYIFELNSSVESFLRLVTVLIENKANEIGIKINDKIYFEKYLKIHFAALIAKFDYVKFYYIETDTKNIEYREDFNEYLYNLWGYDEFKKIKFYLNPDESNETIEISQGEIIENIVQQAEKAARGENYQDVFITAPTGAGKSVIFQIAALYLADKYDKLTIIISPLIALMKDQVKKLKNNYIDNVAYINSELNFIEREEIIDNIKSKKIDLLYLAPETLLSYSVENFIGDREIGLFIVDEAHIVTTWGKGFRPDYWYLGKYISKVRKFKQVFPIVTFTATAVYGGNDDMYDETIESLNMKSTIKYLGDIKRSNISFDINVDMRKLGKEEYDDTKYKYLAQRCNTYSREKKKTIVYFPFAKDTEIAFEHTYLKDIKDEITVYNGSLDKAIKSLSEKDFGEGNKNIMFATKAFGMGIDIDDVEVVYHMAPTGNLNDYVQEIGRSARKPYIKGTAAIDFMARDFYFINMLHGMSSIKQYQTKATLKRIYNIYEIRKEQNFLVTPNDFSHIFSSDSKKGNDELERKVKTVLLMLEKDLELQYRFPVMISRPRSVFTKVYVVIEESVEKELLYSKYGKYFTLARAGRKNVIEGSCTVSDFGNVYLFDIRRFWEENYPQYSFAKFKYLLFNRDDKLDFKYKSNLFPRYKISINTLKGIKGNELQILLNNEIDKVNRILDKYKENHKNFNLDEFYKDILALYGNKEKSYNIAHSYIDLISPQLKNNLDVVRQSIEFNNSTRKYRIINSTYQNVKRDIIGRSDILRKLSTTNEESVSIYYPKTEKRDFDLFRVLYLLEIFELSNYKIIGGESPEIFIRINDPLKIKRLASENSEYKNLILQEVTRRHENSIKILTRFFIDLKTDESRWEFIENYFLGKDVLTEYFK